MEEVARVRVADEADARQKEQHWRVGGTLETGAGYTGVRGAVGGGCVCLIGSMI